MSLSPARRALAPAPTLPLAYFVGAHLAFALAAGILVVDPGLPGAFHYHPRLIAVVHLVTLGWISASILGAFYIVAPLALAMPFAARRADHVAYVAFWLGTSGMVAGFWRGDYAVVGIGSLGVIAAILLVAIRAWHGLLRARLPFGVALHVGLAFVNVLLAGSVGVVLALARAGGLDGWSPLAVASAHAHLAVVGWGVMMIVGISYRLVPMFLPAAMPTGRGLAWSAVLLEAGTLDLAWSLATGAGTLRGALVIVAGLGVFVRQVRGLLGNRRPRPAEMVGRDWSTWQTHVALLSLLVAVLLGVALAVRPDGGLVWAYGVTGIVGCVAQMVVGIQGRLLPLHAWYRAMQRLDGDPPPRSVHRLADGRLALAIFLLWLVAVPLLAAALTWQWLAVIATASALLLSSTVLQAVQMRVIVRRACGW